MQYMWEPPMKTADVSQCSWINKKENEVDYNHQADSVHHKLCTAFVSSKPD